ncbi:MAG: hypothetical protein ABH817_00280 [archaeon]
MEEKERQQLKDLVEELESIRGRHTELVTIYVPAGHNINSISQQVKFEQSMAKNIKSKTTQKNVIDALERISRILKQYKQTPKNGLAFFSGNVSTKEGQTDIKLWVIEPPQQLNVKFYRCDQTFVVDPLKQLLEPTEAYGLLVLDRREATFGVLEGKHIFPLRHLTSGVPGKFKTGGQCVSPETIIETEDGTKKIKDVKIGEKIRGFNIITGEIVFSKCKNKWKKAKEKSYKIFFGKKYLISSGDHFIFKEEKEGIKESPASELQKGDKLLIYHQKLEKVKIIKIEEKDENIEMIDIETECKNFFANGLLVHNSAARFDRVTEEMAKEFYRRISAAAYELFFDMPKLKGILIGGPGPSKDQFIERGDLKTDLKKKILAVKDIGYTNEQGLDELLNASKENLEEQEFTQERKILEEFFNTLGKNPDKTAYGEEKVRKALEMGAVSKLIMSSGIKKALKKDLEEKALNIGAEVIYVSEETDEGIQFKNLKGIGALLRFKVH